LLSILDCGPPENSFNKPSDPDEKHQVKHQLEAGKHDQARCRSQDLQKQAKSPCCPFSVS
jgi:hypothetical protein